MTGTPFTAMLPATSNFANGLAVPIPTLPVFLVKILGGLSQKFQLRYTHGPISLNSVFFAVAIFFAMVLIVSFEVVGVALTAAKVMLTNSRHTTTLRTSLNVRVKFFLMRGSPTFYRIYNNYQYKNISLGLFQMT
jgi:hypothetical protein